MAKNKSGLNAIDEVLVRCEASVFLQSYETNLI